MKAVFMLARSELSHRWRSVVFRAPLATSSAALPCSVADQLGVDTDPNWPVLAILVLVPAAVIAVNIIGALPARTAARTRPAVILRSE